MVRDRFSVAGRMILVALISVSVTDSNFGQDDSEFFFDSSESIWADDDSSSESLAWSQATQPPPPATPEPVEAAPQPAETTPQLAMNPQQVFAPQPAVLPAAPADLITSIFGRSPVNARRRRLARVPDMFGDTIFMSSTITGIDTIGAETLIGGPTDLLLGGGARHTKIGTNNKALPVDRIYFNYNYFANASQFQTRTVLFGSVIGRGQEDFSLYHYTFGVERTLFDGDASIELRLPLANDYFSSEMTAPPIGRGEGFSVDAGEIGNLAIILKALLYEDETTAFAAGLGIETPTGRDAHAQIGYTNYRLENESVILQPFLAAMFVPDDQLFVHAFLQVDVAANGDPLHFEDAVAPLFVGVPPSGTYGELNDQTLMNLDLSTGYWLFRDRSPSAGLTGLAALAEFHYTTTLQPSNAVTGSRLLAVGPMSSSTVLLRSRGGQVDVVNFTAGLHFELYHDTSVRVGGVFPLRDAQNRFFDAELAVQLIRRL